jgi:hypothetical protein
MTVHLVDAPVAHVEEVMTGVALLVMMATATDAIAGKKKLEARFLNENGSSFSVLKSYP